MMSQSPSKNSYEDGPKPEAFTLEKLNKLYAEADEKDREVFSEQRSNILLIAGDHYSKINSRLTSQMRQTSKTLALSEQKLRLTKNHMHRVHRTYVTAILSEAPGTTVLPKNTMELQDQKEAELNESVWQDIKYRHEFKNLVKDWASDFVGIGEVVTKIFWDPMAGKLKDYEGMVDEATGEPVMEPHPSGQIDPATMQPLMQQKKDKSKPIFTGDFNFERVYGFNLLREAGTESMDDKHRAWVIRKMVDLDDLRAAHPDLADKLQASPKETYIVFDANKGGYLRRDNQVLVREFYWQPCIKYPEGYFVYATKDVILSEGPLPYGLFPIIWQGFDKYPTTPRGRSILKVARPYQAEVNRASSQSATQQMTLGDDKLIYNAGSKMSAGTLLPGVRGIAMQGGQPPTILPGRNGGQFSEYIKENLLEMDAAVMLQDVGAVDNKGVMDPFLLLYKSATQKKRYSLYIDKFEDFLCKVTELCLELAKVYLPDDMLIPAIGRREMVNIAEFRTTQKLSYEIKVEAQSETIETQFGRQLTFQHILQYIGKDLDKKTIGKILKQLPFGNFEDSFDDLTIDEDIVDNDMLALERGEPVEPTESVDAAFMIKKLTSRIKKPDFRFLSPQVQNAYRQLKGQYEQIAVAQEQKILAAKNEFIPVDGTLVTCDFYLQDPQHPGNEAKRARIPQRALEWLLKRLQEQGVSQQSLEGMNSQTLSEMADMLLAKQGQPPMPGQMPQQGQMPPQMMRRPT
jgi:hypothetical protein